jgi:hypothetical protein
LVVEDCDLIIKINPKFIKSYYRKANALFKLEKYNECISACNKGLSIEQEKEILNLRTKAETELSMLNSKVDRENYIKHNSLEKTIAYLNKNDIMYSFKSTIDLPQIYQSSFSLEGGKISTSIIIFYPEFSQLDFIQDSKENDILFDHLVAPLEGGLPWDEKQYYNDYSSLKAFIVIGKRDILNNDRFNSVSIEKSKIVEVGQSQTIIEVLKTKDYIIPKVLEVYILSVKSPFYAHFISQYNN